MSYVKQIFRKLLGIPKGISFSLFITDFIFRKILCQNRNVTWIIHHTSTIHSPQNIKRGKNVYPGDSPCVYINALNGIEIGDNTNIGPHVGLISTNHNFIDNNIQENAEPIIIGKHCWIGKGATILPNVELGDFTIVGAGAVVTKKFKNGYCIIAGNPAKIISLLNQSDCIEFANKT